MVATPMALARAFTKRSKRTQEPSSPTRGTSVKYQTGSINRLLISLPTELISTTNVQALHAPDIGSLSTDLAGSDNDSDFARSFLSTPILSADTSSIDSSPITPITPDLGDEKSFFDTPSKRPATSISPHVSAVIPTMSVPAVPQRASSHSKKAHVELSRKRSMQRMSPPPNAIVPTDLNSVNIFSETTKPGHPFHKELAQVNEVAEEFGLTTTLAIEEQEMQEKGLLKFGVEDYLDEIAGLYGGVFEDRLSLARPWL